MDYALNEDQASLVSALQAILNDHAELPQAARRDCHYFDHGLQRKLAEAGFLDAAEEFGPLGATLVVIETARIPVVVEVAASALIAPQLLRRENFAGPVAIVDGANIHKAQRNLSMANTALIDLGDVVVVLPLRGGDVESVDTIFGYPFGRFREPPNLESGRQLGRTAVAALRQWSRVALAAEIAGAAQGAVAFTVDYVKQRQVFGRAVGSFQAVQHRLAQCHQIAQGMHYLALRAAWSGDAQDADLAACYAQQHVQKLMLDLHQFNGAMGVTNEHLLHLWTYRLRALQAEIGGVHGAALDISARLWGPMKSMARIE